MIMREVKIIAEGSQVLSAEVRERLCELNRELMVVNADYDDLITRLSKVGRKIFNMKVMINELLDRKA